MKRLFNTLTRFVNVPSDSSTSGLCTFVKSKWDALSSDRQSAAFATSNVLLVDDVYSDAATAACPLDIGMLSRFVDVDDDRQIYGTSVSSNAVICIDDVSFASSVFINCRSFDTHFFC